MHVIAQTSYSTDVVKFLLISLSDELVRKCAVLSYITKKCCQHQLKFVDTNCYNNLHISVIY